MTTNLEAGAQWWADQLLGDVVWDNGDRSAHGLVGMLLGSMLASKHPVTDEQAQVFKAALIGRLTDEDELFRRRDGALWIALTVDYHPDTDLRKAAEVAGIHESRFPIKTTMYITDDNVVVGLGYRAPLRLAWAREDWKRPMCLTAHGVEGTKEEDYWKYLPGLCGKPIFHEGDGDMGHGDWQPAALCICGKPMNANLKCWSRELGEHPFDPTGPELP